MAIEDFDFAENLMIETAIEASGSRLVRHQGRGGRRADRPRWLWRLLPLAEAQRILIRAGLGSPANLTAAVALPRPVDASQQLRYDGPNPFQKSPDTRRTLQRT